METYDDTSSPVYYKIYLDGDDNVCLICMQWFDEPDYDQDRFLSATKFESEEAATQFLRDLDKELPDVVQTAIDKFLVISVKNILD